MYGSVALLHAEGNTRSSQQRGLEMHMESCKTVSGSVYALSSVTQSPFAATELGLSRAPMSRDAIGRFPRVAEGRGASVCNGDAGKVCWPLPSGCCLLKSSMA